MEKLKEFISKIKEAIKNNQFLSGIFVGGFGTLIIIFIIGLIF